jgi:hypothetical protein
LGDEKPKQSPMQWKALRSKSKDVQKKLEKENEIEPPTKKSSGPSKEKPKE